MQRFLQDNSQIVLCAAAQILVAGKSFSHDPAGYWQADILPDNDLPVKLPRAESCIVYQQDPCQAIAF
jgi:hypothetical protein